MQQEAFDKLKLLFIRAHDLAESYKNHEEEDEILSKDRKTFVLNNNNLQMEIVTLHHNTLLAGHPGQEKTLELLERFYFWSKMATYVKCYVSQCDWCTYFKGNNMASPGKLQPLDIPNMPWMDISVDFITDLPLHNSYNFILVIIDCFSKEIKFVPCNKTVTALEMAKLYLFHVWKNHRLPHTIVSDCGPQFASQVMKDLCKSLKITPKLSTTHYLQTDEQIDLIDRLVLFP